jgi:ribose transport system substrate-binding protein
MSYRRIRAGALVSVLAIVSLTLAACGSSDSKSSTGASTSSSVSSSGADAAAASALLAPYTGKASAFPVDAPLTKKPPAGTTLGFLQCSTPICGLLSQIYSGAAKALGVKLQVTKAGASAADLQSAVDSIAAQKPSAVILTPIEPSVVTAQLKKLDDAKIPTLANGLMEFEQYGIDATMFNKSTAETAGKVLAAYAVKDKGDGANVVFYTTPELSFGPVIKASFGAQMKQLCASCKVRNVDIGVATIGNAAPSRVVSDLQANPDTNVAVFSTEEAAVGLPAAMRTAGLQGKVDVIGYGPNPANLQDIKSGGLKAALGLDLPVMAWSTVDEAARLLTGQDLTAQEQQGTPPLQILEKGDIVFDPAQGFTGYPDFPARFAKLWAAGS